MVDGREPTSEVRSLEEAYAALDLYVESLRNPERGVEYDLFMLVVADYIDRNRTDYVDKSAHYEERRLDREFAYQNKYPGSAGEDRRTKARIELEILLAPINRYTEEIYRRQHPREDRLSRAVSGHVNFSINTALQTRRQRLVNPRSLAV